MRLESTFRAGHELAMEKEVAEGVGVTACVVLEWFRDTELMIGKAFLFRNLGLRFGDIGGYTRCGFQGRGSFSKLECCAEWKRRRFDTNVWRLRGLWLMFFEADSYSVEELKVRDVWTDAKTIQFG